MRPRSLLKSWLLHELRQRAWLGFVREAVWSKRVKSDNAAVRSVAQKLGIAQLPIETFAFSDEKPSDTLFILGSGCSVNELTSKNFDEIRKNVSVGINVWVAHEFVPDVYSLESGTLPLTPIDSAQRGYLAEQLKRQEVLEKKPKIILLRPAAPSVLEQFVAIPEPLRDRTYLYGRANLPEFGREIAGAEVGRIARRFLGQEHSRPVVPDNGASVVRLIFLGLKSGFKKIVLVGIDLNLNPYFWLSPDGQLRRPELAELFPRASGVPHETTAATDRPHNTLDVIRWLSEKLARDKTAQLFAASASSHLAEFLDLFPWNGREQL